jgi:hypothetical protein
VCRSHFRAINRGPDMLKGHPKWNESWSPPVLSRGQTTSPIVCGRVRDVGDTNCHQVCPQATPAFAVPLPSVSGSTGCLITGCAGGSTVVPRQINCSSVSNPVQAVTKGFVARTAKWRREPRKIGVLVVSSELTYGATVPLGLPPEKRYAEQWNIDGSYAYQQFGGLM